jgi:hypothetical protein
MVSFNGAGLSDLMPSSALCQVLYSIKYYDLHRTALFAGRGRL